MSFNSVVAQPITVYVRAKTAVGCAFASEAHCERLADAGSGTGHQCDFAL